MKEKTAVSVIVPIYNGENYIENCCSQLAAQTLKEFEFILVDDGSTDRTLEICHRMEEKYANCKVLHQTNQGVSTARNHGMQIAGGEYIGFVDVDDAVDTDMFECLYTKAEENDLDILGMEKIGEPGTLTIFQTKEEALAAFLESKIRISACNKIFRRSLRPEFSFPDGKRIYEDCMAMYRALCKAERVGTVNVQKYHYIQREGSSSRSQIFSAKYLDAIEIVDVICGDAEKEYQTLQDACMKRKAHTYLRISKIYYLRHHPAEFAGEIKRLKDWLRELPKAKVRRYYRRNDLIRYVLYLYCFPLFCLLIRTVDRR